MTINNKIIQTRCTMCNKKVGIVGFSCGCGGTYCTIHRHLETHNCTNIMNIKQTYIETLTKNNPKIGPTKVPLI